MVGGIFPRVPRVAVVNRRERRGPPLACILLVVEQALFYACLTDMGNKRNGAWVMNRILGLPQGFTLILLAILAMVPAADAQRVQVVEKHLSNGMRLLLVERHDEPSIAGGWVAHVGSSNERPGMTGTAHLFEHMMFKGTETIGTKNYAEDQKILAEQETVRDGMRAEEAKMRAEYRRGDIDDMLKPENKTPRWR